MTHQPELPAALAELYEGETALTIATDLAAVQILAWWRPDPGPHWHLITQGLAGTQLTVRLASDESAQPPGWATAAIAHLAKYVSTVGLPARGSVLNLGPLFAGFSANLRGLWFVADPELPSDSAIATLGSGTFMQVVGITQAESRAITTGHAQMVGHALLERSPIYLTEPDRASVVSYPDA